MAAETLGLVLQALLSQYRCQFVRASGSVCVCVCQCVCVCVCVCAYVSARARNSLSLIIFIIWDVLMCLLLPIAFF